jgi:DNA-binding Lrp family transcriptional regulator
MQNVNATKEKILSIIQKNGPSFPVQIARAINVSPLFTSVFLSELFEDNKLKMSHMKVGSSSLYFLPGQESQLENFIEHLNQREKEAFSLIKSALVLEDGRQTPVMRVALRAIKDFAIPFKITSNNAEMIFWKYFSLSDDEFDLKIQKILNPAFIPPQKKPEEEQKQEESKQKQETNAETPEIPKIKEKKAKKKSDIASEFAEKLKDYLLAKDVEILEAILEKKKEFVAKVRIDTLFGKQEYYLIAKDKKKINETDLTLALQKAQTEKMPALIMSPGEIDKKAHPHLKEWRNMIKFEKVKF